jgi:hypothetical protein
VYVLEFTKRLQGSESFAASLYRTNQPIGASPLM